MNATPLLAIILIVDWAAPSRPIVMKQDFSHFGKLNFIYYRANDPDKGEASCKKVLHRTLRPKELKGIEGYPSTSKPEPFAQSIRRIAFDMKYNLSNAKNVVVAADAPKKGRDACGEDPCEALGDLDQTLGEVGKKLSFQMLGQPLTCNQEYKNIVWENEVGPGSHLSPEALSALAAATLKGVLSGKVVSSSLGDSSGVAKKNAELKAQPAAAATQAEADAKNGKNVGKLANPLPSPLSSLNGKLKAGEPQLGSSPRPEPSAGVKSASAKLTIQGSPMKIVLRSTSNPALPPQEIGPPPVSVNLPAGTWALKVSKPAWLSSLPEATVTLKEGDDKTLDIRNLFEANWIEPDSEKSKRVEIKLPDGSTRRILLSPGAQPLPVPKAAKTTIIEVEAL